MGNSNFSTKKEGIASEFDLASIVSMNSSLAETTWNWTLKLNNGNESSGSWTFNANRVCLCQQLLPQPCWWSMTWNENGNHFTIIEQGAAGAYGTYSGSHYNGKGSGSYVVNPPDASQDGVFTMTKVK